MYFNISKITLDRLKVICIIYIEMINSTNPDNLVVLLVEKLKEFRIKSVVTSDKPSRDFINLLSTNSIAYGDINNVVAMYIREKDAVSLGDLKPKYILSANEFNHDNYELCLKQEFKDYGYTLYQYKNLKRIIFFASMVESSAVTYYRMLLPAYHLLMNYPDVYSYVSPCGGRMFNDNDVLLADLCIFHRYHPELLIGMDFAKECGKKIIYDTDDLEIEVNPTNPAYFYYTPKVREEIKQMITMADYVTVSTPYLRQELLPINSNIKVLRNKLDLSLPNWNLMKRHNNNPVVIWVGYGQHADDLMTYSTPIINAINDTDATFLLCGYKKITKMKTIDQKTGKTSEAQDAPDIFWDKVIKIFSLLDNKFQIEPPLPITDYPFFFSLADIVIAPLKENRFAKSKSELKVLEAWAYSLPVLTTDIEPYHIIEHGKDGYLASSVNKFGKLLKTLIKNQELREFMGNNGRKKLEKSYDSNDQRERYELYQRIIK